MGPGEQLKADVRQAAATTVLNYAAPPERPWRSRVGSVVTAVRNAGPWAFRPSATSATLLVLALTCGVWLHFRPPAWRVVGVYDCAFPPTRESAARFLAGSNLLLVPSPGGVLRLWDVDAGREVISAPNPAPIGVSNVSAPAYQTRTSADGTRALTGGLDGWRLWDLRSGAMLTRLGGGRAADPPGSPWAIHAFGVRDVAVSPDGRRLLSVEDQGNDQAACIALLHWKGRSGHG